MNNKNLKNSINTTRLVSLDYLKAFAIILVIITHTLSRGQELLIVGPFWINMAVPIFMIVSGFTNSMSMDRNNIKKLKQYFNYELISRRLSRLLIPYIITVILETIIFVIIYTKIPFAYKIIPKSFKAMAIGYLTGGWGPGSYYVPILIQLLILFPIMFLLFKKSPIFSTILFFTIHLCFDILSSFLPISDEFYRLSILRYPAFIIMGIILYFYKEKLMLKKYYVMLLSIFSVVYITMSNYYGYTSVIFSKWISTSLPTVFLAFALTVLAMNYLEKENKLWFKNIAKLLGQSSYHIFLVQMVSFKFGLNYLGELLDIHIILQCILNIIICCIFGIGFYLLESMVRSSFRNKIH